MPTDAELEPLLHSSSRKSIFLILPSSLLGFLEFLQCSEVWPRVEASGPRMEWLQQQTTVPGLPGLPKANGSCLLCQAQLYSAWLGLESQFWEPRLVALLSPAGSLGALSGINVSQMPPTSVCFHLGVLAAPCLSLQPILPGKNTYFSPSFMLRMTNFLLANGKK